MSRLWFIDALDALAGNAFASYRDPDLDAEELDMEASTVFIGAPDFAVEPIASRATGLAATRGSFQLGLFLEEREIGFPALEDVAEFVRRAFLAGGGGDGDAGVGPVPPPPDDAPRGGGETKLAPERRSDGLSAMRQRFMAASEASRLVLETSREQQTKTAFWRLKVTEVPMSLSSFSDSGDGLLGYAGAVLLAELLWQSPSLADGAKLASWWRALDALGSAIDRLGAWVEVVAAADSAGLEAAGQHIIAHGDELFVDGFRERAKLVGKSPRIGTWAALRLMSVRGRIIHDPDWNYQWHSIEELLGHPPYSHRQTTGADTFEDLTRWALPAAIRGRLSPSNHQMTLADLLSLLIAHPASIDMNGDDPSLLLFAAAHLRRDAGQAPQGHPTKLISVWRSNLVNESLLWLQAQMPRRAFPSKVEALVRSAASLRYGSRGGHHDQ